ncbi:MAG: hypothetical protein Q3Y15_10060, partial [Candidatus Copromonas sp.]|nr:hypothetical protein [Candidatus Copromonas sp.]
RCGYACKNKDRLRAGGNSKIKLLKRESKDSPEAPTSNFFKIKWWVIHDRMVIDKKLAFMSGVSYGTVKRFELGNEKCQGREK